MTWRILFVVVGLLAPGLAAAQTSTDISAIDLTAGSTALTLDLSDQDYELILYSTVTATSDTSRRFAYSVSSSTASARPLAIRPERVAGPTDRDRLEAHLRREEQELAVRLRQQVGWRTPASKTAQPTQI
ncbi:MAG: hypothetical protein QGI83_05240, partial [Candidatus Latescibacteria bacterium]|nr:hypothetical protein [Candidatus Latescibacterota bacterium]